VADTRIAMEALHNVNNLVNSSGKSKLYAVLESPAHTCGNATVNKEKGFSALLPT
jgi:hypothetical protein